MNRVLKSLILSDVLLLSGLSFVSPIIAIFINDRLIGGNIFTAGLATTLTYLVQASILIPIGRFNDNDRGNRREFITLVIGIAIISLVPLSYIFINRIEYFFTAQIIYGVGLALYYPGWFTIWTRFISKFREGKSWAVYGALTSASTAITAFVGGLIANFISFDMVFIMVSIFGAASLIMLFIIKNQIYEWPKIKSSRSSSGL